MSEGRRVVVTGMGALTALGNDVASTWEGLVAGRSGVRPLRQGAEPVRTAVTRIRAPREELAELEAAEVTAVSRASQQEFWSGADRFPDLSVLLEAMTR